MTSLHRCRAATGAGVILLALQATPGSQQHGPPYTPEAARGTFRIADGFRLDLFAAEPLVQSPVAMEVDEYGRLFVVEMPGYPLDVSGSGRVVRLEDTDGDGLPDRRTVFADRLRLPTGIMRWKNGVLVTDSPQVWYLEDADGDGRAEIRREVLTGFALSNPQHNTNTPLYGLDNWIYLANEGAVRTIKYQDLFGDRGGEVRFPDAPDAPRLPPNADGRNVRFRPETRQLEMLAARSQFGQTFDAWGRHFLVVHNRHVFHEVLAARYLQRNPSLVVGTAVEQLPDYPLPVALFPITRDPEFQLLTDVGVMTAASGLTYYLADLFPPAYRNAVFVAESAHNLVHVSSVRDHGVTFRASRMFEDREFLASTDAWFRPVNFYLGPDGALYLLDYYRRVVEHPEWMDDNVAASGGRDAGRDMGRIYRIAPDGAPAAGWLDRGGLAGSAPAEMVRALSHANVWWRRHAQRLLVDRGPAEITGLLATHASGEGVPVGKVHALWTLEGLGRLDAPLVERALQDPDAGVRENAIRIAELHLDRVPSLRARLLAMPADPDPKVRYQHLLTLGSVPGAEASDARTRLLLSDIEDPWMQVAALSAAHLDTPALFAEVIDRFGEQPTDGARTLVTRLAAQAAAGAELGAARALVQRATAARAPREVWWRAAAFDGVVDGLPAGRRGTSELHAERELVTAMLAIESAPDVRRAGVRLLEAIGLPRGKTTAALVAAAQRTAADQGAPTDARVDAVRLLALDDRAAHEPLLYELLARPEPVPVQVAALQALAAPKGTRAAERFVERWEQWTPGVRSEAVQVLVREPGRVRILLDGVEAGRIRVSEIDWPLRVRMMMSDDDALRKRARALLGAPSGARREAVTRYRAALERDGTVVRGRTVFERACAACHQYRGSGGTRYGPDLAEVRGRLPEALITDILHPNASIADGYELWSAELADGSVAGGIISAETSTSVTFRQPGGAETTIARARIVSLRIAPVSAMPEGLEASIDVQEMADLIAFIRGGS